MVKGIMLNVEKLIKDLKSKEFPEARAYLRILGEELGFIRLHDLQYLGRLLLNGARTLQGIPQMVSGPGSIIGGKISLCSFLDLPASLKILAMQTSKNACTAFKETSLP